MYVLRNASSCHTILFAARGRHILVTLAVAPEIISHGNAPYKTVRESEIVTVGNSVNATCSFPQLPGPGGKQTLRCALAPRNVITGKAAGGRCSWGPPSEFT